MVGFFWNLFRLRTLFVLLGLMALAALVWYGGPLLALWDTYPFLEAKTRILVIFGIFGLFIGIGLFRYWRARRANARMINKLMDTEGLVSLTETQSQEEVSILRERFEDALKLLKETRFDSSHGSGFLLDLPWYIIIGPPGSGKTTLLRNSGLDFPLAERVGADVLPGVGGTRNCDWWFTNEGVLLDTAGRYTTQDSNAVIDRAAWRGFLDLLNEFRRRRPINGVMLAISLDDILSRSPEQQSERIETFRLRLQELMRSFGMRLPVYLMITKCDLLSGFAEFFDTLTEQEREQVWGMTFTPTQADATLQSSFDEYFSELLQRVLDRMPERLQDERDPMRRRLIYAFPQQFGAVRNLIGSFVGQVFRVNRYEMAPMLRGVYVTSGTQEGTPIDRLLGSFSRAFGISATETPRPLGKGKTFFVHRFLSDVLFAESGLVGFNKHLERRLAVTHLLGYAAAAAITVALGVLWLSAFGRSSSEAGTLSAQAAQFAQLRGPAPPSSATEALPELNKARFIAEFYDHQGFLETWVTRVGLSGATVLSPRAHAVYQRTLTTDLFPIMVRRIEAQLAQAAIDGATTNEQLHDELKLYLMLGDSGHFERATVLSWMREDAAAAFPLDAAKREALLSHYEALLDLMPLPVTINQQLVAGVRQLLVRVPQANAVYALLRRDAVNNPGLPPYTLGQAAGAGADVAFADPSGTGLRTQIPGFYTRAGFYNGFVARLPDVVRDQMQTDWVLGQDSGSPSVSAAQDLIRRVADLYVKDYIAAWQSAISNVALTRWNSFDGLTTVLQVLIGADKPLEQILTAVKTNTDLPRNQGMGAVAAAAQPSGQPGAKPSLGDTISKVLTTSVNEVKTTTGGLSFPDPWPGDQIAAPFRVLTDLVSAPSGQQPPITKVIDEIGAVYAMINKIGQDPNPSEAALRFVAAGQSDRATDPATILKNDAATKPQPLRGMMLQIANAASMTIVGGAQNQVLAAWRSDVLPACQAVVSGHYPFDKDAKDETEPADFAAFFKPGGTIDQFAKTFEGSDDKGVQLVSTAPKPRILPAALAEQIAFADHIRDSFFGAKGGDPLVKFSLEANFLDPRLEKAVISINGQSLVYRHDPPRPIDFQWPSPSASSEAKLILRDYSSESTIFDEKGPWAAFRLMEDIGMHPTARSNIYSLEVQHNDLKATFALTTSSLANAFDLATLRQFRCLSSF